MSYARASSKPSTNGANAQREERKETNEKNGKYNNKTHSYNTSQSVFILSRVYRVDKDDLLWNINLYKVLLVYYVLAVLVVRLCNESTIS